jgi:hypothetical protein
MTNFRKASGIAATGLALILGAGKAGNGAEIKPIPSSPVLIADGRPYSLTVFLDNHGLNGERTRAAEWKLSQPISPFLNYTDHQATSGPGDFFFFEGQQLETDDQIYGATILSSRSGPYDPTDTINPFNHNGSLSFYTFSVDNSAPFEVNTFRFSPDDTFIINNHYGYQELNLRQETAMIVPSLAAMAQNLRGPYNPENPQNIDTRFDSPLDPNQKDGDMDMHDLAEFQRMYSYQNPNP